MPRPKSSSDLSRRSSKQAPNGGLCKHPPLLPLSPACSAPAKPALKPRRTAGAHPGRLLLGRIGLSLLVLSGAAGVLRAQSRTQDTDGKYQQSCIDMGCHPVELGGTIPRHLPYLEGECLSCHFDHTSEVEALLKPDMNSVCLECHTELEVLKATFEAAHPPESGACVDCHDPHESRVRGLLREDSLLETCADCHEDFLEAGKKLPFRHDFFDPKKECGTCHHAHSRSEVHYLRRNVEETCLTCHDLPIQIEGRKLEQIDLELKTFKVVHEAIDDEGCSTCHTPHGSVQSALLVEGYPAGDYEEYRHENYNLCWKCHDPALAEDGMGVGVTGFRDHNTNLHRLHVVELRRGRACHICHTAHASNRSFLLRETIRFGEWNSEFGYEATREGGSCETACHRPREYRRTEPSK